MVQHDIVVSFDAIPDHFATAIINTSGYTAAGQFLIDFLL